MGLTRQERFDIVLKAIETQPYTVYRSNRFEEPNPSEGEELDKIDDAGFTDFDSLKSFVDGTWIDDDREKLFEHVANRILNALDAAYLDEEDKPRLESICEECGASIAACNAQTLSRQLAEKYYRTEGHSGTEALRLATLRYPDLRYLKRKDK